MGKTTASCFRMITCGGDSTIDDPQNNASSVRHGWSFRKRSARHRVLSTTIVSEVPSSANKAIPESTSASFPVQPNLASPEKISVVEITQEKNGLPAKIDSGFSEAISVTEDDCRDDVSINESSIIIIQAAIRGYLARQVLLKQKNAIKLQAAVRGHLVRRHAVGTLRCIQAIVKMQTLVRKRRTRLLEEGSGTSEKQNGDSGKSTLNPMLLFLRSAGKRYTNNLLCPKDEEPENNLVARDGASAEPNINCTYTSAEKLLSNKFARQLMESTPKTQPIKIKCEPSKSDSAWKWLERWMSVSSAMNEEPRESGSGEEKHNIEDCEPSEGEGSTLVQSGFSSEAIDFKPAMESSGDAFENDELITYDADELGLHACSSISPSSSSHPMLQNIDKSDSGYSPTRPDPTVVEETVLSSKVEMRSLPDTADTGNKQCLADPGQFSTEQLETDAMELSPKARTPTSVATPSKHEEGSTTTTYGTALLSDSPGVQSSFNSASTGPAFGSRQIGLVNVSISNDSTMGQLARSDCGTELSISSTLDSPDRPECGANDLEQDSKILDAIDHPRGRGKLRLEATDNSDLLGTELSYPDINQLVSYEGVDSVSSECVNSVVAAEAESSQLEKKTESEQSNLREELEPKESHLVHNLLPEESPTSCTAAVESQTTPSSQMSVEPDKTTGEKHRAKSKKKRVLSPATPKRDSPPGKSLELQPKEHKTGKRRHSFDQTKPDDDAHEEPKDGSSSNYLPSYMQATKSARAKAISNGSPQLSPDVQDIKYKGSSPHALRTLSQAQLNTNGTGNHSPQERKWRI